MKNLILKQELHLGKKHLKPGDSVAAKDLPEDFAQTLVGRGDASWQEKPKKATPAKKADVKKPQEKQKKSAESKTFPQTAVGKPSSTPPPTPKN